MEIRLLNEKEAEQIYHTHMERDFPPSELKPFSSVQDMMHRGMYEPLALYEDGQLAAYAWQTVLPDCPGALLDYFAVLPDRRGGGVGTRALHALVGYYTPRKQTLILECEHPAFAPDPAVAKRRVGFYLRAGARATAMESLVFRGAVSDLCPALRRGGTGRPDPHRPGDPLPGHGAGALLPGQA